MTLAWLLQDFTTVHLNNNTAPEEPEQEHSLPSLWSVLARFRVEVHSSQECKQLMFFFPWEQL